MIEDDDYELASAYCDGELDAAQRAVVENDPRLVAVVSEIKSLRERLQEVPDTLSSRPVSDDIRERQLSLAGAAFDELYGGTSSAEPVSTPSSNIIDLRSRRRYRILTMAAGFVMVAGIGALAVRGAVTSGSTNDSADFASMAEDAGNTEALEAPMAAETESTEATEEGIAADDASEAMEESDAMADAPVAESEPDETVVVDEESTVSTFLFAADDDLVIISDNLGVAEEEGVPPFLDGCAPALFELDAIASSIPIVRGGVPLEYIVTLENEVATAHLIDTECVELEQLVIETGS